MIFFDNNHNFVRYNKFYLSNIFIWCHNRINSKKELIKFSKKIKTGSLLYFVTDKLNIPQESKLVSEKVERDANKIERGWNVLVLKKVA